jgi:hypothetical protein
MNIFLIDFENVNESSLEGIKNLKSGDFIYIFHGEQLKTIPLERTKEMIKSSADIDFISTHKTGKNYLDFQLSTYIGYLIGKENKANFFIISKDTGFDSVIDFWKSRNISISRQEGIIANSTKVLSKKESSNNDISKSQTIIINQINSISTTDLLKSYKDKIRKAVKEDKLAGNDYKIIYYAVSTSKDLQELNNQIVNGLGNTKCGIVYKHIKEIFKEYIKASKNA